MTFHDSAEDIRVDDGHILRARLRNGNGDFVDAEIDLNSILGNSAGTFTWGGENFSGSANNITFSIEGGAGVPILRANLNNDDGGDSPRDINLDERINNNNGQFEFS